MADKHKSNRALLFFGTAGCFGVCVVIVIVAMALIVSKGSQGESQTKGSIPIPPDAITAKTMSQVKELYRIPQAGNVYDVAWAPDGIILAAAVYGTGKSLGSVQLIDAVSGGKLRSFDQKNIFRLAFSHDGQMLAAVEESGVVVWNVADGRELISKQLGYFGARSVAFSLDSRFLAYRYLTELTLLEMPSGRVFRSLQHANNLVGFAFLPDGQSVITSMVSSDKTTFESIETTFTIWDIDSGNVVRNFSQPGGSNEMIVAPDGKTFATSSDILGIYDMATGRQLQSMTGFRFGIPRFAFSPDGSVLAVGEGIGFEMASPDGLRLCDVANGNEAPMLEGHNGVILGVAFSPDGRLLATASEDKTVRLWGIPPNNP